MSEKEASLEGLADSRSESGKCSIDSDWPTTKLKEHIELISGAHVKSDKVHDDKSGEPYLTGPEDFEGFGFTITKYTDEPTKFCEPGDILVTVKGSGCGSSAFSDRRACISRQLKALRPESSLNSLHLYYSIQSKEHLLETLSEGSAIPGLSNSHLTTLDIPLPPLEEQRKIASVLYTVDQAIRKTDEAVLKTRRLKKGAIQDILTWGIGDKEQQDGRVGAKLVEYPKHWQVKTLGELCDIKGGKRLPKGHDYANNKTAYPYLRVVDFADGTIDKSDLRYLSQETYQEISKYTISSDDVYISIAGTLGLAGTVPDELDGANLTENAAKCCNLQGIENEFLKIYLRSSLGQAEVQRWTVGTSQPKLAIYRLRKFEVLVPPVEEQREIIRIINGLNKNIQMSSHLKDQMIHLKRGLMQDLLSGDVRTHDKNIEVVDEVLAHG